MNYLLKPSQNVTKIHQVWISEPSGARLSQFDNIPLRKGIAQLEHQLSKEPALGQWKIHLKVIKIINNQVKLKAFYVANI